MILVDAWYSDPIRVQTKNFSILESGLVTGDEVYSRTLEVAKTSALSHEVYHSEGLGSERKWLTVSKLIE